MGNKVRKSDKIVDAISWAGLILLWLATVFLRVLQSYRPGAIGVIGSPDGPTAVFFTSPFLQMTPAIAGTVLFLILTLLIRINPRSILSMIFRYLRLATIVAACYFTVAYITW